MKILAVCTVLLMSANATAATCEDPIGELHFATVDGTRLEGESTGHVIIARRGETMRVHDVLPLCAEDQVTTSSNGRALIILGRADGPQFEIMLEPKTTVILRQLNELQLRLGALFADVEDRFDVVMPFGWLGATGTAFSLQATETGFSVDQIEGETRFEMENAPSQLVSRYNRFTLDGTTQALDDLDNDRCFDLVASNSRFVLQGVPATPSSLPVRDESDLLQPGGFDTARAQALCENSQQAKSTLGRAYVALRRPDRALSLLSEQPTTEQLFTSMAQAMLDKGLPQEALARVQRALTLDTNNFAALLLKGDAHSSLGVTLGIDDGSRAARQFAQSNDAYVRALRLAASDDQRARAYLRLGELALLRTPFNLNASEQFLSRASRFFERSATLADLPHATVGLANIEVMRAQLIPTQQMEAGDASILQVVAANILLAAAADQQRKPHREKAAELLRSLLENHPLFSPALVTLARLEEVLEGRDEARTSLLKAMSGDPSNRAALAAYADIAPSRAERKMYRAAYKTVQYRGARKLEEKRRALLAPKERRETIPVTPLTADAIELQFNTSDSTKRLTWHNRGEQPSRVTRVRFRGTQAFAIDSNSCEQSVAPGERCTMSLRFAPEQANNGDFEGTLRIEGDGGTWRRDIRLSGYVPEPIQ